MSDATLNHIATQKPRPSQELSRLVLCKQCKTELGSSTTSRLYMGAVIFHGRIEFTCSQCGRKHRWYPNLDTKQLEPLQAATPEIDHGRQT
jgi:RNase P subunit RPR2